MEGGPVPVWAPIKVGYRDFFKDLGALARLALKPLLVGGGLFIIFALGMGIAIDMRGMEMLEGIGGAITLSVLSVPVAVSVLYFSLWVVRRRLLGPSSVPTLGRFSWGPRERRYIGWGLLISLLPAFTFQAAASLGEAVHLPSAMIVAANTLLPTVIVARFALVFPAIAADVPNAFRAGWRSASGSWLRLAAIYLATVAPTYGFLLFPDAAAPDSGQAITQIVTSLILLIAIPAVLFISTAITAIASADAFTWKFGAPS